MVEKLNLELLVRDGCHLCDEALAVVTRVLADMRSETQDIEFELTIKDVDANPQLLERYSDEVPVLFVNGAQRAFWRIDESHLRELLIQLTR